VQWPGNNSYLLVIYNSAGCKLVRRQKNAMRGHPGFALLLGLFSLSLLAAQQTTGVPKEAKVKSLKLPAPTSTTAYDPFFSEGRPVWERGYLVYVDPHSPRVDLYDKDKDRASVKVVIPGFSDLTLSDATVTEDGRLIVSGARTQMKAGKSTASLGSQAVRDGYRQSWMRNGLPRGGSARATAKLFG
jgi:HSP20 family molecular chaperone IbpA